MGLPEYGLARCTSFPWVCAHFSDSGRLFQPIVDGVSG